MRIQEAWRLVGLRLVLPSLVAARLVFHAAGQGYWDINGASAGASSGNTAAATWGAGNFWSANANGTSATTAWQPGQLAVFSAGTNASGAYTVTVSGNQIVSGIRFEEGTLTLSGGTLTLTRGAGNATLEVGADHTATINSRIDGVDGLIKAGAGTLILGGDNTYSGVTDLRAGTLGIDAHDSLGSSTLNLDGGALAVGPLPAPIDNAITISANTTILGTGNNINFSGNVNQQGGNWTVTIDNPGGQTTFSGSTLTLAEKSQQRVLTLDVLDGNVTVESTIQNGPSGRPDGLTKTGSGTLTLTGNNTFTGPLEIYAGTLILGQNAAAGQGVLSLADGTTIGATDGPRVIPNTVSFGNNVTFTGTDSLTFLSSITLSGDQMFTVENTTIFSGKVSGKGSLFKEGAGTLVLSGNNSSYGAAGDVISVDSGTLAVGDNRALGKVSNTLVLNGGSVAAYGAARTLEQPLNITKDSGIGGSYNLTFNGPVVNRGGSHTLTVSNTALTTFAGPTVTLSDPNRNAALTLDVTDASGGLNISGTIQNGSGTGLGTLIKDGGGTLTLGGAGANTFSGGFIVNDGTVTAAKVNALGAGPLTINDGTVDIGAYNQTVGALTLVDGTIDGTQGQLTASSMAAQAGTINATLAGSAALVKSSPGVLTLSAPNLYTGGTTINGGTVVVRNSTGSGTGTGPVSVNSGGTLAGTGTIAGTITLNSGAILSPGIDSIGTLHTGNQVWNGGSTVLMQVSDADGSPGTGWDSLAIAGTLTLNATSNNPITLDLQSLSLSGSPGAVYDFTNSISYTWRIASVSGGITLSPGQTINDIFSVNLDGFGNDIGLGTFTFSLENGGQDIVMTFNAPPVPEPSVACMTALGFFLLVARFRVFRRRHRAYPGPERDSRAAAPLTRQAARSSPPPLSQLEAVGR